MAIHRWVSRWVRWLIGCAIVTSIFVSVFPSELPAKMADGLVLLLMGTLFGLCLRSSVVKSLLKVTGVVYYQLWPYVVMAIYSYDPMQLWPCPRSPGSFTTSYGPM